MQSLAHAGQDPEASLKGSRSGMFSVVGYRLRCLARGRAAGLVAAGLLLVMALNLLSVIARKSITIDETSAIPSGYYYLTDGAFDINSEHPPLPKILAALPLLFLNVERPPLVVVPGDTYSQRTVMTAERFWTANHAHFRQIFFWARVPMVVITILLGSLIFFYARRLFGARAAVLAVALYSLVATARADKIALHPVVSPPRGSKKHFARGDNSSPRALLPRDLRQRRQRSPIRRPHQRPGVPRKWKDN
jgi:hypothetical protein